MAKAFGAPLNVDDLRFVTSMLYDAFPTNTGSFCVHMCGSRIPNVFSDSNSVITYQEDLVDLVAYTKIPFDTVPELEDYIIDGSEVLIGDRVFKLSKDVSVESVLDIREYVNKNGEVSSKSIMMTCTLAS